MALNRGFVVSLLLLAHFCLAPDATSEEPVNIGSRRELFLDEALIDKSVGRAERRLHSPMLREIVLRVDQPWEGNASGYRSEPWSQPPTNESGRT